MCAEPARLSYDVVMVTRNRPEAVALSVPLILGQDRLPREVFIIDSSDDPAPIAEIAAAAAAGTSVPVHYIRSERGSARQRNLGLARGRGDVVLFPDDDSLCAPGCAAALMAVYEADTEGAVAAVCARPLEEPLPGMLPDMSGFVAERPGALRTALRGVRQGLKERAGAANPFLVAGTRLNARHARPAWLAPEGVVPVPYMTGFRMSFRRGAIEAGFDETLRRYAWFEDIDASFTAMRTGLVVMAQEAGIYHHRAAARRDSGYRMGLWAILNRGYVVMKAVRANPAVFPHPEREARRLRAYCTARTLVYRAMARDAFGRDRARGARDGLAQLGRLIDAAPEDLSDTYTALERSA